MYTFKLQAVLDHRQFVEDNLKRELTDIRQRIEAAQQQLDTLERKKMDTATALKREQQDGLSSDLVVGYHAYFKRLAEQITRQEIVVIGIKDQEAVKKEELREAMKNRQILEKLKDHGLERYNQAVLKKEMNFIDEIAVNQFARRTIEKNGDNQ